MLKKLSFTDRQRVTEALTKCAAETKDIEQADQLAEKAYAVFAKELGDNPGLFKAACQVYNSCKSIHKLDSATDETRGNSFAILNVPELTERLGKDNLIAMRKVASAPFSFTRIAIPKPHENKLAKAASETKKPKPEAPEFSKQQYRDFLLSDLAATEECLIKYAAEKNRTDNAKCDASGRPASCVGQDGHGVPGCSGGDSQPHTAPHNARTRFASQGARVRLGVR